MPRLVVNPGSPAAWEIQLKPGDNFIGRGFSNDFKLTDPSVSGSHCQVTVSNGTVVIKDLGSTNGTYVNRAPVSEVVLQTGQTVQLGGVEMVFYADGPSKASLTKTAQPIRVTPVPPQAVAAPVAAKASVTTTTLPPPMPPPIAPPLASPAAAIHHCKYHPSTLARFYCPHCQLYFCELCVNTRDDGSRLLKFCRVCANECTPLQVRAPIAAAEKSFFARMFTAFSYPLKGDGIALLLAGTVFFCILNAGQFFAAFAGLLGLVAIAILTVIGTGYLTCFLQCIITSTAMGESKLPDWPDVTDVWSDVVAPFLQLLGTVLACFIPAIAVGIFAASGHPSAVWGLIPALIFGCVYFPMAFLAVAMLGSIVAVNPLVVLPTIVRVPLAYFVTLVLFLGIIAVRGGGEMLLNMVMPLKFITAIIVNLLGLYLLTVEVRVLGLLYLTNKAKFGWLAR